MKNHLILFYSKSGNSKFIAQKLATEIHSDIEVIKPMFEGIFLLLIFSLLKIPIPVKIANNITEYDKIIIVGPIWAGLLIAPLKTVLKKCIKLSKEVHFAVTCETKESEKDSKYGYNQVLSKAKALGGSLVVNTIAFPTSETTGYDGQEKRDFKDKIKFTDENFSEELVRRFNDFTKQILAKNSQS